MTVWRAFMARYMPGGDLHDWNIVYGYDVAIVMTQVLRACGADLSRANIMQQAANLRELVVLMYLPGITVRCRARPPRRPSRGRGGIRRGFRA